MSMTEVKPEIGMGATVYVGSDCYPYTVIDIKRNGRLLILQRDTYRRVDNNGQSEMQSYIYGPDPKGELQEATLRSDGSYRTKGHGGCPVALGRRKAYLDPHF